MFLQSSSGGSGLGLLGGLVGLAIVVFLIAAMWTVFTKAGQPGWACLVPFYNAVILCRIAGRPGWWVLLMCIPFVNLVIAILVAIDLAKNFGKSTPFGVGLALLGFIFMPMLAWGDATYAPQPH
jgi:hypothetical protein